MFQTSKTSLNQPYNPTILTLSHCHIYCSIPEIHWNNNGYSLELWTPSHLEKPISVAEFCTKTGHDYFQTHCIWFVHLHRIRLTNDWPLCHTTKMGGHNLKSSAQRHISKYDQLVLGNSTLNGHIMLAKVNYMWKNIFLLYSVDLCKVSVKDIWLLALSTKVHTLIILQHTSQTTGFMSGIMCFFAVGHLSRVFWDKKPKLLN